MKKLFAVVLAVCVVISGFSITGLEQVQAKEKRGTVIDVTKFGADPSGMGDSTEAVRQALKAAKEMDREVTIDFPKGEYHFWKDYASKRVYHTSNTSSLSYPEKSIAILLEDVDNVTLEGNGSSLVMHGDMMAIAAVDSSNVKFHDFVLDYKDADTIDISVVGNGTDENGNPYTDFYVPANYNYEIQEDGRNILWQGEISPVTGEPYWEVSNADFCAMLVIYKGYDQTVARASDKWGSNPFNNVSSIKKAGENVLRFTYNGWRPNDQEVGNIFLLSDSATRKTTGGFFWESENLMVDNIDVHYLSGFGWLTQMCKNVEFKGVDFLPRYGSGKYTTSNADQLHIAGCGGYFKVTDCNFSVAHDDPINIHGSYMRVEEVIDSHTLRVQYIHGQQGGFRQFHKGDEVLFYSRTYLEPPEGESEDEPYIVESSIGPGEQYNGEKLDMRTEIVTFSEDFNEETLNDLRTKVTRNGSSTQEGLYVAENITYTPEVVIRGCHMKSIPTRGILCTTRKPVIIENNVFDNMAMANIYLSNDADYWYESGPIRNMIIRNNEFYIRPTGQNEWGDVSGVYVNPVVLTGVQDAPASKGDIPVHRNITIEGNEFHMANDNAVTATGVDGMKIINNKIIRDDAGIEISMNVADRIDIGEVMDIETDVQETTLGKDVFKFTDCKNVEIRGNTYDEGFNLNVITSGNKMTEDDVIIEDEELTLNKPGGNMVTSASHIQYAVSDSAVAYVNEQGQLVGLKEGNVDVVAYIEWEDTVIKSNEVSVTVGQGSGSPVEISADKDEITTEGGTAFLTYTEGADISILDPVTRKRNDGASVEGNLYTALKEGVVLVHAEKDGKSSEILMINNFEQSYGNPEYMNRNAVTVDNINSEYLSGAKNEIAITAQSGSELYQQDTYVNNLVKFEIPKDMKRDLRIQVKAEGLPVRGEGYNNAGIMLYKDGNNYYSVGKKGHFNGVTSVYEQNASASERGGETTANELKDTVFEIEISDNTATMRYLDAEGRWQTADRQTNINNITDGTLYLALCAWENEGGKFQTIFKNVKIAKASETSTQDMSNIAPIQIFQGFVNDAPVVANVELQVNGIGEPAVVDAQVSDDEEIGQMIYQWTLTDDKGRQTVEYTSDPTYVPEKTGFLKVKVVAVDTYGKSAKQVSSEEEVTSEISSEETLKHLYINGNAVQDFDKEDAAFYIPEEYADQIRISYDLNDIGVSTILKDEDGKILADLSDTNAAVVETPDKLIIERGKTVYRINIVKQKSNVTTVEGLQVNGQTIDLEKEIQQGTGSYFKQLDSDHARIELQADESVSSITATTSFFQKEVKNESKENGHFFADVNLTAGINAFYITVTGADGKTRQTFILYLFRDGYNDSALRDLKVNGESLQGFDPEQKEYTIYVDSAQENLFVEAKKADEDQDTELFMDKMRTEGTSGEYALRDGLNRIIVKNTSQNIWTTSYYILNVIVSNEKNADLLSLTADETLTPEFNASDPETTEYEIDVNKDSLHIQAQAQMKDAKIVISTQTEKIKGTGSVEHDFTIYEGENQMRIEITAPDGETVKVYTIWIHAQGLEYASDRMDLATKTEVGYGSLQLDRASNGNTIALVNEDGEKVEFAKGLGTHAQSEIVYNIEGQGYETFEAYVGIDFAQVSQISVPSSVTFRVVVDGLEKFNSGEMTVDSPMQKVEVDIKDASVIELFVDQGENNYNDHADWADAKFTKPLAERPETPEELSTAVLEYVLSLTEDVSTEGVVESVVEKYNAALKNAQDILERVQSGDTDVTQEMIDDAWQELILAMQYLSFKQGDKIELGKVIEMAEEMAENMDNYLDEGKSDFNQALAEAKTMYADQDAMQEEVDASWKALLSAMAGMQLKPDKSMLEELLNKAAGIVESDYTAESFAVFGTAFAEAKAVYEDEQAKAGDVKAAENTLKDAMEKLARVSGVDNEVAANVKGSEKVVLADTNTAQKDTGTKSVKSAKTGDTAQSAVWLILLTGAAMVVWTIRKRKIK